MELWNKKPKMVRQAVFRQVGLHWSLEFLIAVALYFAASFVVIVIQIPFFVVIMIGNGYFEAVRSGNMELGMEILLDIQSDITYQIVNLFSFIGITAVILLYARFGQKRPPGTLGFLKKGLFSQYLIGLGVGFVMFSGAVLFCMATGSLKFTGLSKIFIPELIGLFFLGYLIQGMAEEVLCRGYMMTSIARKNPAWLAILLNSLFFAMLHLGNPGISPLAFVNLILFGVFASLYFWRTENIWGISAIHSIWNFVQGNFYGVQVSGMAKTVSVLDSVSLEGKAFLNGGSFGMEGGLGVTLVFIAGIALVLFLPKKERTVVQPQIKAVLFDLDGTLLPMNLERFSKGYMGLLAKKLAPLGYEEGQLTKTIWEGVEKMVKNDGSCTNEEAFWKHFEEVFGSESLNHRPVVDSFYCNEFNQARMFCGYEPMAKRVVHTLKDLGYRTVLATNPLFPATATEARIVWAELRPKDFETYTTYENCHYCKPNPDYYRELLSRIGCRPEECLMVGNDVAEDMVAATLGMKVFLMTSCLINREKEDYSVYPRGDFGMLLNYIEEMEA